MKKGLFITVIVALMVSACTQSKRLTVLEMPQAAETQVTPIDVSAYLEKYAGHDGVYLECKTTVEHSGNKEQAMFAPSGWSYSYVHESKKLIINPEAAWLTTVEFPYAKPKKLYMRVIAPDGQVRMFGPDDLVKFKDSDRRNTYKFVYPNIQKGTIIEMGYDYTYAAMGYFPPIQEDFPLQFRIPCENLNVSFAHPDWWTVAVKRIGKDKSVPVAIVQDREHKKTIISYQGTDIAAVEAEPYGPYFKEMAMYLNLQVTSLQMAGTSWKREENWGEFVKKFRKYTIKKSEKRSELMEQVVDSLIANCSTLYEKMDAINDYIVTSIKSEDVDYDGNPTKIIKNAKGNLFEITALAEQMLARAGIASRFILVHDISDGYFDQEYISADQLLFPALHVILDTADFVLFPYYENLPANVIPEPAQGQPAVIVTEETFDRFWEVPYINRMQSAEDRLSDVTIDTSGRVIVQETRVIRGSDAYHMRTHMREYTKEELRDSLRALVSYPGIIVQLDSFAIKNEQDYKLPLEISLYYSSDNSITFAGDDAVLHTAGLLAPVSNILPYSDSLPRKNAIAIYYDSYLHRRLSVAYPPEWKIATAADDVDFSNQFGTIKGKYLWEPGRFIVEQEVSLNRIYSSRENYNDLVALIGTTPKTWVPSIVFNRAPNM